MSSDKFSILIILIILLTTIIFSYAIIRLCLYVVKPPREEPSQRRLVNHLQFPGGYALPSRPIRVVLARDEEAAGLPSETTNIKPPAYGVWRQSVVRSLPNNVSTQALLHILLLLTLLIASRSEQHLLAAGWWRRAAWIFSIRVVVIGLVFGPATFRLSISYSSR